MSLIKPQTPRHSSDQPHIITSTMPSIIWSNSLEHSVIAMRYSWLANWLVLFRLKGVARASRHPPSERIAILQLSCAGSQYCIIATLMLAL